MPRWLLAVYLTLLFLAFGAAGRVDMLDAERMAQYVAAHEAFLVASAGECR